MPPIAGTVRVTIEVADVRYPILSVAMLVANGHRVFFRGQEVELSTTGGAVAPLMRVRGLWSLQMWVNNSRGFLLVDSGAACHVCPPAWAHRIPESKQSLESSRSSRRMCVIQDHSLADEILQEGRASHRLFPGGASGRCTCNVLQ